MLDPLSQQAVAERVLALVEPQPKSQRILRRAWRSAQRLGARDRRALGAPARAASSPTRSRSQLAALRRLASVLGAHFLEEEGDDLVATVRRVAHERGSTYVFVGTPDECRRREILRGSLLSRSCASCRASTSASSPTGPTGRRRARERARRRARRADRRPRRALVALAVRGVRRAAAARRATRAGSSCRSPGQLDPTVLDAAIRIARAEDAVLVPAYLLIVPLEYAEDSPLQRPGRGRDAAARGGRARRAAGGRAGRRAHREGPHARPTRSSGSGRSSGSTGSSRRRPHGRAGGFTEKQLAWLLTHAPTETLVLKPAGRAA